MRLCTVAEARCDLFSCLTESLLDDTLFRLKTWNAPKLNPKGELRQISIHTVLLGSPFGFLTMKTIADQNNGIFTSVPLIARPEFCLQRRH